MTNARDAFDDWHATEPAALHNLTIAEIWMAAYDQGRTDENELHQPADDPEPPAVKCYGCGQTYEPTEYGSAEHARHLGDSGVPRDVLIGWLDELQAERDRWIRAAGCDPAPGSEPGPDCRQTDACLCRACYIRKYGTEPPGPDMPEWPDGTEITTEGGVRLVYSPGPPRLGNLVASHVPEGQRGGVDRFGNHYPAGIGIYGNPGPRLVVTRPYSPNPLITHPPGKEHKP